MIRAGRPELVLLDLHLPELSGEEVLRAVRAEGDPGLSGIPVLILTADATPGRERELREAGATDHLSKPIDVRRLLDIVGEHLPEA